MDARSSILTIASCIVALLGGGVAQAEGSLPGLLLRFDEPADRRFTDYSGSGHTITPVGSVTRSSADKISGTSSVCFDGNGYLQIDASPDFVFSGELTIDFWFKSSYTERQHALSFGNYLGQNNIDFDFADRDNATANGPVGFWLYWNSGGTNKITSGTRLQYMDGKWHHVAMVRSKGVITAYMDGVAVGQAAYSGTLGTSTQAVLVGNANGGLNFKWQGCIDELRIINGRALWTSDFNPWLYLPPPLNAYR